MHELSIASEIIDIVEQSAGPDRTVLEVRVVVGALSGVCADSLSFCFGELAKQRGLEKAALVIDARPCKAKCRICATEQEVSDFAAGCPACGSLSREIISGYECDVDAITVEEPDDE